MMIRFNFFICLGLVSKSLIDGYNFKILFFLELATSCENNFACRVRNSLTGINLLFVNGGTFGIKKLSGLFGPSCNFFAFPLYFFELFSLAISSKKVRYLGGLSGGIFVNFWIILFP